MPIRWSASGLVNGWNGRIRMPGGRRTAGCSSICATAPGKARRRRLESLAPLYQAIAHGCRAVRHQETLDQVYVERICRLHAEGSLKFYSVRKLGAFGTNLAAIAWFFEKPYETPNATLTADDQVWVRGEAASALSAQGRVNEALPALQASLTMRKRSKSWKNAARDAFNLSGTQLLAGEIRVRWRRQSRGLLLPTAVTTRL